MLTPPFAETAALIAALEQNGITLNESLIIPVEFNFASGADRTRQLLASQQCPNETRN